VDSVESPNSVNPAEDERAPPDSNGRPADPKSDGFSHETAAGMPDPSFIVQSMFRRLWVGPRVGYPRCVDGTSANAEASPEALPDVYDENGVDRSLIRSSLGRSPTECLDILEDMHQLAESARRVGEPVR
jgi:hypothetical protein